MDTPALCAEIVRVVEWRAVDRQLEQAQLECMRRMINRKARSGVRLVKLFGEAAMAATVQDIEPGRPGESDAK